MNAYFRAGTLYQTNRRLCFPLVHINNSSRIPGLTHAALRSWLEELLDSEGRSDVIVSLTFVDGEKMIWLNERYSGRKGTTDVLAFSQQDGEFKAPDSRLLGDVIVDVSRVRRQAQDMGVDRDEELLRVVAHGFLHLLGYDHRDPAGDRRMRDAEEKYVRSFQPLRGASE